MKVLKAAQLLLLLIVCWGSVATALAKFPVRQIGLSADVGKTLEGIQTQIMRMQKAE